MYILHKKDIQWVVPTNIKLNKFIIYWNISFTDDNEYDPIVSTTIQSSLSPNATYTIKRITSIELTWATSFNATDGSISPNHYRVFPISLCLFF